MENEEQQSIPPESEKDATLQEMNVPESETDAIPSMEAAPEAASAEAEVTPSEVDASIEQSPSDANIAQPTTDTAQPTFAPPIFATMTDVPTFLAFIFPLPFTFTTEDFKDFHLIPFDIPFIDNFKLFPFINTRYVLFIFTLITLI